MSIAHIDVDVYASDGSFLFVAICSDLAEWRDIKRDILADFPNVKMVSRFYTAKPQTVSDNGRIPVPDLPCMTLETDYEYGHVQRVEVPYARS